MIILIDITLSLIMNSFVLGSVLVLIKRNKPSLLKLSKLQENIILGISCVVISSVVLGMVVNS